MVPHSTVALATNCEPVTVTLTAASQAPAVGVMAEMKGVAVLALLLNMKMWRRMRRLAASNSHSATCCGS